MQRQVCWIDRLDDGVKREIRVTVARPSLKWQFKRSDEEQWDYTTPASAEDWDALLLRMENRYQRRTAAYEDVELVRRLREKACGLPKGAPAAP